MNDKPQSREQEQNRHLQAPGEANRDKHINFGAIEAGDPDPSMEDDGKLNVPDKSTLPPKEEKEHDNSIDRQKKRDISIPEDDVRDANSGRLTQREIDEERRNRE